MRKLLRNVGEVVFGLALAGAATMFIVVAVAFVFNGIF